LKQGAEAEQLAQQFLQQRGYQIITTNFTCRGGELDIVAQFGDLLCFVEVKQRTTLSFGLPQESIRHEKQRRMIKAAKRYLQKLGREPMCRFDVVSIYPTPEDPIHIELIQGAFTL
jgi:putative endonuclease